MTGYGKNKRAGLLLCFIILSLGILPAQKKKEKALVVLQLNDTHSRMEPYTSGRNAGKGGVVRQHAYVEQVRRESGNVLLFHSGDFVQGTPYFNLFKGAAEMSVMNFMKFDACCIGNHEFDNGLEAMATIVRSAEFPVLATNYDFTGTPMEGLTQEYCILFRDSVKIGVIGIGIKPAGLVSEKNYSGMKYLDPIETANKRASFLKEEEGCDLVICLSHLGYYPSEDETGDISLAKQSRNIDIILGGHTHTFLEHPDRRINLDGEEVVINQTGAYGIYVGRLDVILGETEP